MLMVEWESGRRLKKTLLMNTTGLIEGACVSEKLLVDVGHRVHLMHIHGLGASRLHLGWLVGVERLCCLHGKDLGHLVCAFYYDFAYSMKFNYRRLLHCRV